MKTARILAIDRLRMGTDGDGITTLISFYGCPLKCKYCINSKCHESEINSSISSYELFNQVKRDNLYFLATGGGITFVGGEPLLNSEFIEEFLNYGAKRWHTTIETSLNVPYYKWENLIGYIDAFIVDVKDINQEIYKRYTQSNNIEVIENLNILQRLGLSKYVLLRLPFIEGYNNKVDIEASRYSLEQMGFSKFDEFKYITKNGR